MRLLPRSLLPLLSDSVAAHLGLHFPPERWPDLERGLSTAAHELGHRDPEQCARWLLSTALTRKQSEILASHLTIGETYFFREPEGLRFFTERIVPDLLRSRSGGDRRLRIWSAGCATGEEPYSIAMLLDGSVPDLDRWNISILATDINPRFLRKAACGLYGDWSFRGLVPGSRERYFRKRVHGLWELDPRIRSRVKFSYLNLASDAYPSLLNDTNAIDVIFCRNVLMYFSAERRKEIAGNFCRALVPGGWLMVSAAETSNASFSSFQPVQFAGGTLYRKGGEEPAPVAQPLHFRPETPSVPVPRDAAAQTSEGRSERAAGDAAGDLPARARRCANEGKLKEAAVLSKRAIGADKMNPAHHYLLSAVQREMGESDQAVHSLRRALYLDHDFVLAHVGLANIELSRGRRREAERHFANALTALRGNAPEDIVPESDGLTAGRLVQIITSILEGLPEAAGTTAGSIPA